MSKIIRAKLAPTVVTLRDPLNERERMVFLKRKLMEETAEFLTAETREEMRCELVDLAECIYALAIALGLDGDILQHMRIQKVAAKGGFLNGKIAEIR